MHIPLRHLKWVNLIQSLLEVEGDKLMNRNKMDRTRTKVFRDLKIHLITKINYLKLTQVVFH